MWAVAHRPYFVGIATEARTDGYTQRLQPGCSLLKQYQSRPGQIFGNELPRSKQTKSELFPKFHEKLLTKSISNKKINKCITTTTTTITTEIIS